MKRIAAAASAVSVTCCFPASAVRAQPITPAIPIVESATRLALAANRLGDFVVAWAGHPTYTTYARTYVATQGALSPPVLLETTFEQQPMEEVLDVALADDRSFLVTRRVWIDAGITVMVSASLFNTQGVTLARQLQSTHGWEARAAADASGRFVVVQESESAPSTYPFITSDVLGHWYDPRGAPVGAGFGGDARELDTNPRVALNASGAFLMVWFGSGDGRAGAAYARRYSASGEPTTPVLTPVLGGPYLASFLHDDGGFTLFWRHGVSVRGSHHDPAAGTVGDPFTLAGAYPGTIVHDALGFVVVYGFDDPLDQDDVDERLLARRYDSRGAPLGPAIQVNDVLAAPRLLDVAAIGNGDVVVMWSDAGVYARVLSVPTSVSDSPWSRVKATYR